MSIVKPSPAITVSEHTSIGQTIQTLIDHKVGSVIVTAYSNPYKPVGIFTERDLLKWVFNFKDSNLWQTAIGTIMTKKLITLPILELDRADQVMIQHNIRHLPVTYSDEMGEEHLAGMISMRELFRALSKEHRDLQNRMTAAPNDKKIVVMAKSQKDQQTQSKVLARHKNIEIMDLDFEKSIEIPKVLGKLSGSQVFIMDIDEISVQTWPILLRSILDLKEHPEIFLIYNPVIHEKKNIDAIKSISAGKLVHAFSKPLSLLQYLSQIEDALR